LKKLLLPLAISLSACSNIVPESSLVGDYVANYGNETATLSLKADRTYTHGIRLNGAPIADNAATWNQVVSSGRTVVEFSNFRVVPSYGERQKVKAGWATEVDWTWLGRLQLCFDSDVGYCYIKQ
jgi:hypothetical protein